MKNNEWAKNELDLAKKLNNNAEAFLDNVGDCYVKLEETLTDENKNGNAYGTAVNILYRLMLGKPVTDITEEDKFNEDGVCERYNALKKVDDKYVDSNRLYFVDQNGKATIDTGLEAEIKDYLPEIKLPYYPSTEPILVFIYTVFKSALDNKLYLDRIVFPEGRVVYLNRLYVNGSVVDIDGKNLEFALTADLTDEEKEILKGAENYNAGIEKIIEKRA